jgi:hypothetical protein
MIRTYIRDERTAAQVLTAIGDIATVRVEIWSRRCWGRLRERMTVITDPANDTVLGAETISVVH